MENLNGLQRWLESEFNQVRGENKGRADLLQKDIQYIKEQTTLTSAKILKLENQIRTIEKLQDTCMVGQLNASFIDSEKRQKTIDDETKMFRLLSKNPKLFKTVLLGGFILLMSSLASMLLIFIQLYKYL